jgi:predicted transcriptional regulator
MPKPLTTRQQSVFNTTVKAANRLLKLSRKSLEKLKKHAQANGAEHEVDATVDFVDLDNTVQEIIKAALRNKTIDG